VTGCSLHLGEISLGMAQSNLWLFFLVWCFTRYGEANGLDIYYQLRPSMDRANINARLQHEMYFVLRSSHSQQKPATTTFRIQLLMVATPTLYNYPYIFLQSNSLSPFHIRRVTVNSEFGKTAHNTCELPYKSQVLGGLLHKSQVFGELVRKYIPFRLQCPATIYLYTSTDVIMPIH